MLIAIYSRKSKMTETGDSINNQINMCKDYAKFHFKDCTFLIYEDEGFSGGNTDRPMFKKLIKDINKRKFDVLMCYRLDRISRNVNDFSNTWELLEYNNIAFVSITENFDTSAPLGKAMLSIASVFAELERNTTAQRIFDNFTELSKTNRYLLGVEPEGFIKRKIIDGEKHHNVLEVEPVGAEKIKMIYQKYLDYQSNGKVEKHCFMNNIKTKAGNDIKSDWITRILTYQMYAVADKNTYEYFKAQGCQIVSDISKFNGMYGINVYRRTKPSRGYHSSKNEPENLIIGVGEHEGIINSMDWIAVQNIVAKRKHLGIRKTSGSFGLISGLLKCSECGGYMRPSGIRKNGVFWYVCTTKEKSKSELCSMKNVKHTIDHDIIDMVRAELNNRNYREDSLDDVNIKAIDSNIADRENKLNKEIKSNQKTMENLIMRLSKTTSEVLIENITVQVEKLDAENKNFKSELAKISIEKETNELAKIDLNIIQNAANKINDDTFEYIEYTAIKRNLLKTAVQEIVWDGKKVAITLF